VDEVDVNLQASEQGARVLGLRRLIRQKLSGIAETAEQMVILQAGVFAMEPRGAPGALDGVRGPLQRRTA
jgi:hypothetical protein